ncbi:MAG: response regulator transcription factor [Spirochaetales bacterium]|nr:response regulator transcription factor [Spirochaetales bacterium]
MSPKAEINISVVSEDPIFINRLKILSQNSSIKFKFIEKSWTGSPSDLFLIDAGLLGHYLKEEIDPDKIKFIVRGEQKDLKPAFDAGCIDFLKIPCDMEELEIRISKIFSATVNSIKWKGLILKQDSIVSKESSIKISIEEYKILKMLIQNLGEPVPREALYFVLPGNHKKNSRVVDMHISNLRKKIQQLRIKSESACGNIKSVRGYGYIIH